MKQTRILMGMPITIEIIDEALQKDFSQIFSYFEYIDEKFSTYKKDSEISKINSGDLLLKDASLDMKLIFKLAEEIKKQTLGYFDIFHNGKYDPSGIVKGWAIFEAAKILKKKGFKNFYVEAGGDIQVFGKNEKNEKWKVGIRNPFKTEEIVKVLAIENVGMATSGTYLRGNHIYNPKGSLDDDMISLTVVGPNVYKADIFATSCFAMGEKGVEFLEKLKGFEGYLIDKKGLATMTSGFEKYIL